MPLKWKLTVEGYVKQLIQASHPPQVIIHFILVIGFMDEIFPSLRDKIIQSSSTEFITDLQRVLSVLEHNNQYELWNEAMLRSLGI